MKVLALVLLAGCYMGARGSVDTAVRAPDTATGGIGGALDLGLTLNGDHQAGQLLVSMGTSPLVARGDDSNAPRLGMGLLGGRYETMITSSHPNVRLFGRLLIGSNLCEPTSNQPMMKQDLSCSTPGDRRDAVVYTSAVGVALTSTRAAKDDEMMPAVATVGLAIVYTYASDAVLGTGDFLGLELSAAVGGDLFDVLRTKSD